MQLYRISVSLGCVGEFRDYGINKVGSRESACAYSRLLRSL